MKIHYRQFGRNPMKVEGPGGVRGGSSVRRTGKSGGTSRSDFAKQVSAGDEDEASTRGVGATAGLSGVMGVLAIQEVDEVDDAAKRASRGKKRAQEMLDKLDEIRLGLLSGELTADRVVELARTVQSRRVEVDDPKLAEILDAIDLRAQVELAKLTPDRL